ncbi:MAG: sulfotransferase family protein [Bacteroidota bacterium]
MDLQAPYVFVCGSSRSGTTLMSRVLGNHSQVHSFQELHFFDEMYPPGTSIKPVSEEHLAKCMATLMDIQRNGYFNRKGVSTFHAESLESVRKGAIRTPLEVFIHFLNAESSVHSKSIPCEQTPQTVFAMEALLAHLPLARFVIMVRDPREVLLSQKGKWKRRKLSGGKIPLFESLRSRINYHPATISRIWCSTYQTALKHANDSRVLLVKYEDLTNEPQKTIQQICTHIGIPFEESMLDVPVVGSSNFNDSTTERGIASSRKGKWMDELHVAEIKICEKQCASLMEHFNYEPSNVQGGRWMALVYKAVMPFQLCLAVLFNLKRLKDPVRLWKRFFG